MSYFLSPKQLFHPKEMKYFNQIHDFIRYVSFIVTYKTSHFNEDSRTLNSLIRTHELTDWIFKFIDCDELDLFHVTKASGPYKGKLINSLTTLDSLELQCEVFFESFFIIKLTIKLSVDICAYSYLVTFSIFRSSRITSYHIISFIQEFSWACASRWKTEEK